MMDVEDLEDYSTEEAQALLHDVDFHEFVAACCELSELLDEMIDELSLNDDGSLCLG